MIISGISTKVFRFRGDRTIRHCCGSPTSLTLRARHKKLRDLKLQTYPETTTRQNMSFDPKPILDLDGWLTPHIPAIEHRHRRLTDWINKINASEGGLEKFSRGYERYGLNVAPNGDVVYREWAPGAVSANLIGDFSEFGLESLLENHQRVMDAVIITNELYRRLVTNLSSYDTR